MRVTRRQALSTLAAAAGSAAVLRGRYRLFASSAAEYSARTVRLVEESVVVDLLNQFQFPDYAVKPPRIEQWLADPAAYTAADAARYRTSGITCFALGAGSRDYDDGIRFFAEWNGLLAGRGEWLMRIDTVADFARAKRDGLTGVMLTLQDSTHFRRPDDVNACFGLGQRISQLTYNMSNRIGSGFLEQRDGGLTVFGLSILERMQQVGMAVDLSHCGDQTTLDGLAAATRPVLFTHANARALLPGRLRCKTDEMIGKLAALGGVMGISFLRFMAKDTEPVTIEDALDHVDHVAKLAGVEHVAIGSDLDLPGNPNAVGGSGFDPRRQPNFERYGYHEAADGSITIDGLDHPKRVYDFTEGLTRRGYSDGDIRLVLGGNAVRALGAIWPPERPAA
ncbi:MAG: membrane dipeptidase [Acidobacteria bacterium]|nr:membrane dipeptidase [Acidobacteriota bacterium]